LIVALISSSIATLLDFKDTRGALTFWGAKFRHNCLRGVFGDIRSIDGKLC
jgi:hypothetical protein